MKAMFFLMMFCTSTLCSLAQASDFRLPNVEVFTLDGSNIIASELVESGKPAVILIWKFNDRKSFDQLLVLNDIYLECLKDKNIRVIAICTDLNGSDLSVNPVINGNGIELEIFIDRNNDLKRAMEISNLPHTFLFEEYPDHFTSYIGYYPDLSELIHKWIEQFIVRRI